MITTTYDRTNYWFMIKPWEKIL